jgi:dolichyl-phosphate-mannose-protein mannosyltransferase
MPPTPSPRAGEPRAIAGGAAAAVRQASAGAPRALAGRAAAAVRQAAVSQAAPRGAAVAVVALAAWVRLAGLGSPTTPLVDEPYYVAGARSLLARAYEATYGLPIGGELPAVHPPLGKWLIALGILTLGDRPIGWRIAAAVAGIATVALVYLCARRLFPGRLPALAAALLLAVEDLSVVQSRTAMLDGFLAFWLVAAVYALLRDRDESDARASGATAAPGGREAPLRRPWLYAAGALLGCAVATKWSGAYAVPAFCLLALWWAARRADGGCAERGGTDAARGVTRDAVRAEVPRVIGAFVLIPVAVYLLSYTGTFVSGTSTLVGWWVDQVRAFQFHATLNASHPYASSALSWLITRRPMVYFYTDTPGPGGIREVLALGHPLIFLAITPAALWAAFSWWRDRASAVAVPLLLAIVLWLPWLPQDRPMFLYYMTPIVPFVALLEGAAIARLARANSRFGMVAAGAALAMVIALFWFHWPVLTAAPLSDHGWAVRVSNWSRIPLLRFDWI